MAPKIWLFRFQAPLLAITRSQIPLGVLHNKLVSLFQTVIEISWISIQTFAFYTCYCKSVKLWFALHFTGLIFLDFVCSNTEILCWCILQGLCTFVFWQEGLTQPLGFFNFSRHWSLTKLPRTTFNVFYYQILPKFSKKAKVFTLITKHFVNLVI